MQGTSIRFGTLYFCLQERFFYLYFTQIFDKDGSGYVSRRELGNVLVKCKKIRKTEVDDIFKAMDVDEDGKLDYEGD